MDWNSINRDIEYLDVQDIYRTFTNIINLDGIASNVTKVNIEAIKEYYSRVNDCKAILEIGVDNNHGLQSTTKTFLGIKKDETYYFGIDLDDKSNLDNTEKNIFTLRESSNNVNNVLGFLKSKGIIGIDFLFIDGWHSINQCKFEWDNYSPLVSDTGMIGIHDTNWHLGPKWLVEEYIDRNIWNILDYPTDNQKDFGIGFVWKK